LLVSIALVKRAGVSLSGVSHPATHAKASAMAATINAITSRGSHVWRRDNRLDVGVFFCMEGVSPEAMCQHQY
jgi:hypothetical protein